MAEFREDYSLIQPVLHIADLEAVAANQASIGTVHLLLGVIAQQDSTASQLLQARGVSGDAVKATLG